MDAYWIAWVVFLAIIFFLWRVIHHVVDVWPQEFAKEQEEKRLKELELSSMTIDLKDIPASTDPELLAFLHSKDRIHITENGVTRLVIVPEAQYNEAVKNLKAL